jgi:hypothetical protein
MPVSTVSLPGTTFRTQAEFFDDFISGDNTYYTDDSTGTGTLGIIDAGDAPADEGMGILQLDTGAGIGVGAGSTALIFRGGLATVAEMRVKLPATPGDVAFAWGLDDLGGSSCKMVYAQSDVNWDMVAESTAGGGSTVDNSAVAISGGWQTLRIEWDPGVASRFYVDDTLVSTISTALTAPRTTDQMSLFISAGRAAGPASAVYIDWVRVVSQRA